MSSGVPGPARELARSITRAIDEAGARDDVEAYEAAVAHLTHHPAGGRVLGDVVRRLLEAAYPDGLDSDDITVVLGRSFSAAVSWLPIDRVDVFVLLAVLSSALGIHEPGVTYEELPLPPSTEPEWHDPDDTVPVKPPTWPEYAWHGPLLAADMLPHVRPSLATFLEASFTQMAESEAMESP